ncbi:M20/M25/M40 family metallo-hydrolase [Kitasatospora cathayae]|uniref:M20/M25/M40 family metallo-hydrolase n=1 Tax=Kitasatospora cathayae TaxID=3004092 RepID=A0ABY7PWX7_9ACTN|nr:M20/M25/M40 family metallo-hydrolase [Kitasatospora sp. HUAS 3-15]WBP84940.1 M20/M25/M40 family metallo-hydrolase [Kitasatospora sp. HUAS 3-15]
MPGAAPGQPVKDGRVYGRGSADDKSGIIMNLGALRTFTTMPPVHLKIVLEGEEEAGDSLEEYVRHNPDLFKADVLVIADTGNYELGKPTFTTSLRGLVAADVTVRTLNSPVHSGEYGGPTPDAFMALIHLLNQVQNPAGDVVVPDLLQAAWQGHEPDEQKFREQAGVKAGVHLIGTGLLGSRLFGKPSVNVVGLDGPPTIDGSINQLTATATARVSLRIAPLEDPQHAFSQLKAYLEDPAFNPWNAEVQVNPVEGSAGSGFQADTTKPGYALAEMAMLHAYPCEQVVFTGAGGSIPLVTQLQQVNPDSTVLLIGCEEALCRIHSFPESVDITELHKMTLAESYLLMFLGDRKTTAEVEAMAMASKAVPGGM